jgi:hypothetical protein
MLLILLTLCLRKPDRISRLFSIAYTFAGNGWLGHNLIGDPTGCTITLQPSDLTGDPGFGPFTDNGRPGNGHFPLLPTSQAIDAGNDALCPRTDQLGRRRIGPCDIGAITFRDRDDRHDDREDDKEDDDKHDKEHDDPGSVAAAQAAR